MQTIERFRCCAGVLTLSFVLAGCSGGSGTTQSDEEYFKPLTKIASSPAEKTAASHTVPGSSGNGNQPVVAHDSIATMIKEQNQKLNDVVQELKVLTLKQHMEEFETKQNSGRMVDDALTRREAVSNELLLAMIRDQNARLNEVIEQLRLLAANQNALPQRPVYAQRSGMGSAPMKRMEMDRAIAYGRAIKLYQSGKYPDAVRAFESLLEKGLDRKTADRCRFWLGVSEFNLKKFNLALEPLKKVAAVASSEKRESALLMLGQSYEQLGQRDLARQSYQELVRSYPAGSLKSISERKLAFLR